MNPIKQFCALVKFQALVNPFVFFYVIAVFGMPFWLSRSFASLHNYHPSLEVLLMNTNLFFVGFIGVMVLAPELFQYGASAAMWTSGTEFVLTRAVDRPIYFRARSAFYYALVLMVPLISLVEASVHPELIINEYSRTARQEILAQIPNSVAGLADKRGDSNEITLPSGNLQVAAWHVAMVLCTAMGTQILIALIYPLKYRRWIFYAVYIGVIFVPLFFLPSHSSNSAPSREELTFYYFAGHQALAWITTVSALILAIIWTERRMCRMEQ
jgi:hypothetical protein